MNDIKTIQEEIEINDLRNLKEAISIDTTDHVPVDVLQKQVTLLAQKVDELVKEINNIKDALVYGDEHD